jgi:hypothetical protein
MQKNIDFTWQIVFTSDNRNKIINTYTGNYIIPRVGEVVIINNGTYIVKDIVYSYNSGNIFVNTERVVKK